VPEKKIPMLDWEGSCIQQKPWDALEVADFGARTLGVKKFSSVQIYLNSSHERNGLVNKVSLYIPPYSGNEVELGTVSVFSTNADKKIVWVDTGRSST